MEPTKPAIQQNIAQSTTTQPSAVTQRIQKAKKLPSPFGESFSEIISRGWEMENLGCKTFCAKYAPNTSQDTLKCEDDCIFAIYLREFEKKYPC